MDTTGDVIAPAQSTRVEMELDEARSATLLDEQVRRVHHVREGLRLTAAALVAAQADFDERHASLIAHVKALRGAVAEEEAKLRGLAVAEYQLSGSRKPSAGVEVKEYSVLEYDAAKAFEWAKASGLALSLDEKAFQKIAGVTPLPFVEERTEPRATIAKDLGKVLGEAAPAAAEVAS